VLKPISVVPGVPVIVFLLDLIGFPGGMGTWSLDRFQGSPESAESDDIYIVHITDEDYRSLFESKSPLPPKHVEDLLAKVIDLIKPRVVGVDLDTNDDEWRDPSIRPRAKSWTAPPAFRNLIQIFTRGMEVNHRLMVFPA
jgi:CHASE2 domain-containing sensor protein